MSDFSGFAWRGGVVVGCSSPQLYDNRQVSVKSEVDYVTAYDLSVMWLDKIIHER